MFSKTIFTFKNLPNSLKINHNKFYLTSGLYLLLSIINGYIFGWINSHFNQEIGQSDISILSFMDKLFLIVFFAPIIETLGFQYIPIEFSLKYLKRDWAAILLSSLLFCSLHIYNPVYTIMAFIGGIILSRYYLFVRKQNKIPLIYTILFHSIYNLYGLLFVN